MSDPGVPARESDRVLRGASLVGPGRRGLVRSPAAKVVIDERNGTVVMGSNVRLATVAIAHGNLMVQIKERPRVSQPLPFSQGETTVTTDTSVTIKEGENRLMVLPEGVSIGQVVQALNAIGVTPRDLIAILQAIKAAGALQGELEII